MSLNTNLTPGIHAEPDGLAWWQESDGTISIGEETIVENSTEILYKPLCRVQVPPPVEDDQKMWVLIRRWMATQAEKHGVKRSS